GNRLAGFGIAAVSPDRSSTGAVERKRQARTSRSKPRQQQYEMGVLHPCQPAFSDAHTAVAPHQLLVLEAKICSFEMRWGVQPWMDRGLETREPVFPRHPHMEMRM